MHMHIVDTSTLSSANCTLEYECIGMKLSVVNQVW